MNYNQLNKTNALFKSIPLFQSLLAEVFGSVQWLVSALPLKVYRSKDKRLKGLVDSVYMDVAKVIDISSPARTKEAIKIVLINLWMGSFFGKPVRYSRDKNAYKDGKRYTKVFLKYNRLIPVIDALEQLGLIKQKIGFFVFDKRFGRQTRMWATDDLLRRFEDAGLCEYGFFSEVRSKDPIILKDSKKRKVQYVDNAQTKRWRRRVEQYNSKIDNSKITVVLTQKVSVTIRFLIQFLYTYVIKGAVRINSIDLVPLQHQYSINTNSVHYHHTLLSTLSTITQKKRSKGLLLKASQSFTTKHMLRSYLEDLIAIASAFDVDEHAKAFLDGSICLGDMGIMRIELTLAQEQLHRVFNDGSFRCGGRFYGALHQGISSELRQCIRINGSPVTELDYSGFHLTMLYHMKGLSPRQDPYGACEGEKYRSLYKKVGLIAINAENPKKAYGAIREEIKNNGLSVPVRPQPIKSLVTIFKQTHKPIQEHLFSGVGTKLQNMDSEIMNAILGRLMDMDIVGLPVHDSVIVPRQHKDTLEALMVEEYEKQMRFKPVVEAK